ncbi:MAG: aromatic ring-hydroxylating dioxygenase subunit alpha [Myxococcota bacterium]
MASPKGTSSAARIEDDWYVLAESCELGDAPIQRELYGTPIVLFRSHGKACAFIDRCPHRNVPLSIGRVCDGALECGYHGWRFDASGRCVAVPGLRGPVDRESRRANARAVVEVGGHIWVYGKEGSPVRAPFSVPHWDDPRYSTVRHVIDLEGTVHAVAENALDVPHTAFLHRGLFRGTSEPRAIDVRVRRFGDRAEAEYIGESAPTGLLGRVLAPGGGEVVHFDRFILPSIAQVEYRIGDDSHVVATTALTPVRDHQTRMFASVSFRLPFLPGRRFGERVGQLLKPLALRVLGQDAVVLRAQRETIARFGGERYASTELDALGPSILRLLRSAERGGRGGPELVREESLEMRVG